jgi:hypothetical protein
MTIPTKCVMIVAWKQGTTSSSSAILHISVGSIYALPGFHHNKLIFRASLIVWTLLLRNLFSWRSSYWLLGRFGLRAMISSSKVFLQAYTDAGKSSRMSWFSFCIKPLESPMVAS